MLVMTMAQTPPVSEILQAQYAGNHTRVREILATGPQLDLFDAAATGQTVRVRELLAASPELVNTHAPDGFFPLALAVFFGHAATAAAILDAGADVNLHSRESMKISSLHSAGAARRIDLARMLLDRGANPDGRAEGGLTPLHGAAQSGQRELVQLLIEHGADVAVRDDKGRTPLDLAIESKREEVVALLRTTAAGSTQQG
jgi:ankyrin repeat protein